MWQVVLLNEQTETRTVKLGLHPREPVVDFEITTSSDQNKHRRDSLLLLGRSSHVHTYDDSLIERYLAQSQSKSSPSLPKEVMVKLPYGDSSITVAQFVTSIPCMPSSVDEVSTRVHRKSSWLVNKDTGIEFRCFLLCRTLACWQKTFCHFFLLKEA